MEKIDKFVKNLGANFKYSIIWVMSADKDFDTKKFPVVKFLDDMDLYFVLFLV